MRAAASARSRAAARSLRFSPTGEMSVEAGLVDDGADPGEGVAPLRRYRDPEQRHRATVGVRQTEQDADERRLAGAVRAEVAERASSGDEQLDVDLLRRSSPNRLARPWVSTAHALPGPQVRTPGRRADILPVPLRRPSWAASPRGGLPRSGRWAGSLLCPALARRCTSLADTIPRPPSASNATMMSPPPPAAATPSTTASCSGLTAPTPVEGRSSQSGWP